MVVQYKLKKFAPISINDNASNDENIEDLFKNVKLSCSGIVFPATKQCNCKSDVAYA